MSILADLANKNKTTSTNNTRRNQTQDRPATEVWMNVGYEVEGKFVNLPLGLGVDTMEPIRISGQDPDWLNLSHARNDLLKAVQEAANELEPGAEIELPLTVRIRRVNTQVDVDSTTNPLSIANAGLNFKVVK